MKRKIEFKKKKLKLDKQTIYILSEKSMQVLYTGGNNPTTLDPKNPLCPDTNSCIACVTVDGCPLPK